MLQKVTTGGVSPSQPMRDRIQRLSEYVRHPNSPEVAYRNECQCMDQIRSRCQGDRIAQLCEASGQSRQRCSHNCGRNGGRHLVHPYIHGKRTRCTRTYCNRWLFTRWKAYSPLSLRSMWGLVSMSSLIPSDTTVYQEHTSFDPAVGHSNAKYIGQRSAGHPGLWFVVWFPDCLLTNMRTGNQDETRCVWYVSSFKRVLLCILIWCRGRRVGTATCDYRTVWL